MRIVELLESRVFLSAGGLDITFGVAGEVQTRLPAGGGQMIAVQRAGKFIVTGGDAGGNDPVQGLMFRYREDGTLDRSFGNNGKVVLKVDGKLASVEALTIESDGKILAIVLSNGNSFVERFNINGGRDTQFGKDGIVAMPAGVTPQDIAVDSAGDIAVAGVYYTPLPDGELQSDGDPADLAFLRFNSKGKAVTTFGSHGVEMIDYSQLYGNDVYGISDFQLLAGGMIEAVLYQASGPFLAGTFQNIPTAVVRYTADGSADTSFNQTGMLSIPDGSGGQLQPDGSILSSYFDNDAGEIVVSHYTPLGVLDTAFGTQGRTVVPFYPAGAAGYSADGLNAFVESDGDILVVAAIQQQSTTSAAGQTESDYSTGIARLTANGTLDTTFGNQGIVLGDAAQGDIATAATVDGQRLLVIVQSQVKNAVFVSGYEI